MVCQMFNSKVFVAAAFVAVTIMSPLAVKAGEFGSGATNTTTRSHGRVTSTGSSYSATDSYINGTGNTLSIKQECAAVGNSQCSYGAVIYGDAVYANQFGHTAGSDPVSITTITDERVKFGSSTHSVNAGNSTYIGVEDSTSHTAESFGSF